jgi:hypothetical protein
MVTRIIGLFKTIQSPSGVNATYWKVNFTTYDFRSGVGTLVFDGYYNKDAYVAGAQNLMEINTETIEGIEDDINTDIRTFIYTKMLETPEWSDATPDEVEE